MEGSRCPPERQNKQQVVGKARQGKVATHPLGTTGMQQTTLSVWIQIRWVLPILPYLELQVDLSEIPHSPTFKGGEG